MVVKTLILIEPPGAQGFHNAEIEPELPAKPELGIGAFETDLDDKIHFKPPFFMKN